MATLLEQAGQILADDGFALTSAPGGALVTTMDSAVKWMFLVTADEQAGVITCYSVLGDPIAADRLDAVMQRLTRENYGPDVITFELDLDDGEVRCRSSLALAGRPLAAPMLREIVSRNVAAAERLFPELATSKS